MMREYRLVHRIEAPAFRRTLLPLPPAFTLPPPAFTLHPPAFTLPSPAFPFPPLSSSSSSSSVPLPPSAYPPAPPLPSSPPSPLPPPFRRPSYPLSNSRRLFVEQCKIALASSTKSRNQCFQRKKKLRRVRRRKREE